jgi:GntR family transcriptional regulator/MocR family aminotransferase
MIKPAARSGETNVEPFWNQLFSLGSRDEASLQMQIRRDLVAAILNGTLRGATRLPSSRTLARQLGVARNTVSAAYQQLADDGFVLARPRSAYVVAADVSSRHHAAPDKKAALKTAAKTPNWRTAMDARYSGLRNIRKPPDWHRYPFKFIYGQPDPDLFPTADWRECSRAALAVLAIRDWSSDMIDGDDAMLIEQLQSRVLPQRGIFAAPDEIMITVGAQHALYLVAELLVANSSVVGIEEPGYPDARNIFALRGARLRPLPVRNGAVNVGDLSGCDLVYLTPSHQCPTALTMNVSDRLALLTMAEQHDMLIIEDDYESELQFAGQPVPALKSLDRADRVVYFGSLSKTLAPGLRIGYIVAAKEFIAEARALRRLMLRHPPANNQRAAALFLSFGHHDALVRRIKASLAERAKILTAALHTHASQFSFEPPQGGSSIWIKGPEGFDAAAFAAAAERQGVLVEPGDLFFHVPPSPCQFFRLGYSSIAPERIEEGIRRLASLT